MSQPCFLCKDPARETSDDTQQCLLCNRAYCDSHKGRFQGTCEINHSTYAHDHPNEPNVFPSLGERERTLMTLQSPSKSSSEAPDRMTLATSPIGRSSAQTTLVSKLRRSQSYKQIPSVRRARACPSQNKCH
jgi:hypothetical protein